MSLQLVAALCAPELAASPARRSRTARTLARSLARLLAHSARCVSERAAALCTMGKAKGQELRWLVVYKRLVEDLLLTRSPLATSRKEHRLSRWPSCAPTSSSHSRKTRRSCSRSERRNGKRPALYDDAEIASER